MVTAESRASETENNCSNVRREAIYRRCGRWVRERAASLYSKGTSRGGGAGPWPTRRHQDTLWSEKVGELHLGNGQMGVTREMQSGRN